MRFRFSFDVVLTSHLAPLESSQSRHSGGGQLDQVASFSNSTPALCGDGRLTLIAVETMLPVGSWRYCHLQIIPDSLLVHKRFVRAQKQ